MALRCSPTTSITGIQKHDLLRKKRLISNRVLMLAQPHSHFTIKTTSLHIKASFNNKVFEDPSTGIVCYTDDNGEMICEGYDEGPRLNHQQLTRLICNQRDSKIIEMLQRSWLQVVDDGVLATKISTPMDLTYDDTN